MAAVPQWFTEEIVYRLRGVTRPDPASVQHYAHCPVPRHRDLHRSFAIKPGDSLPLIYQCHVDCSNEEIRVALADLGVPEENLGPYGTPPFEARRRTQLTTAERRRIDEMAAQIDRMHREMADLKSAITDVLHSDLTKMALLKIRLLAVVEGSQIPTEEYPYVIFAERAGVPKATAYRVWRDDPLILAAQAKCVVSDDHVVLTRAGDESQAAQVTDGAAILKVITAFSERERADSQSENASMSKDSQSENDQHETAVAVLRAGGLAPTNPAA